MHYFYFCLCHNKNKTCFWKLFKDTLRYEVIKSYHTFSTCWKKAFWLSWLRKMEKVLDSNDGSFFITPYPKVLYMSYPEWVWFFCTIKQKKYCIYMIEMCQNYSIWWHCNLKPLCQENWLIWNIFWQADTTFTKRKDPPFCFVLPAAWKYEQIFIINLNDLNI